MQWIFLIGNEEFNISSLEKIEYYGSSSAYYVKEIGGRYCVEFGDEHIFYDMVNDIKDFEEDISSVPYTEPTIIMLSYTSSKLVKKILAQDNFPKDIYIDNDSGLIAPLNDFIQLKMPRNYMIVKI